MFHYRAGAALRNTAERYWLAVSKSIVWNFLRTRWYRYGVRHVAATRYLGKDKLLKLWIVPRKVVEGK